jgi:hypothetical protein
VAKSSTKPTYDKQSLWHALMGAEDRANIAHRPYRALHGLRRMVFNDVLEQSGDLGVAMAAIRDTDLKVASKYLQVRQDKLRETFAAMDRKGTGYSTVSEGELRKGLIRIAGAAGFEPATSRVTQNEPTDEKAVFIEGDAAETAPDAPRETPETAPETAPRTANQDVAQENLPTFPSLHGAPNG